MWGNKQEKNEVVEVYTKVEEPTRGASEVGVVSQNSSFKGDISYSGRLNIDGLVEGNIKPASVDNTEVFIGKTGRVTGTIEATSVIIEGEILGTIKGNDTVDIKQTAKVSGEVLYRTLIVDGGSSIEAKLSKIKD